MAANKVIVNNQTILDLTGDTVTAATLKKGVTAHDASGAQITGTMESGGGGSTSETWVLNNSLTYDPLEKTTINFVSNGESYAYISYEVPAVGEPKLKYGNNPVTFGNVFAASTQIYRKVTFAEAPTGDLLTWLEANGVKQPANLAVQPSKDVTIISNGTTEITPDAPYDVMEKANVTVNVPTGGGTTAVYPKDINFYDYDGTCVAAWSLAELAGKTALPDYPTHDGLTCQGWNWTLTDLKAENAKMNVGAMYITTDGKTRIYITLQEGRKSPMLGVCPNGTVTVDWGDGTTPNTLTGTSVSTVKWTPTHNYAEPGDYVITLTVNGTFGIVGDDYGGNLLRYNSSGSDGRNYAYWNAIQRVFLGSSITSIGEYAFQGCSSLAQITLPSGVTSIGYSAFYACGSLAHITIPSGVTSISDSTFGSSYGLAQITLPSGVTSIGDGAFSFCHSLVQITIPSSVTSISDSAFDHCYDLAQITIPNSVTSIGFYMFQGCRSLAQITILGGVTDIGDDAFQGCSSLVQITLPGGVTSIGESAFQGCQSLAHITIPNSVTSIGFYMFQGCSSMAFYDFTAYTEVPTLEDGNAFSGIPADCEIRVPAALVNEWKAATNWATYASKIVGV